MLPRLPLTTAALIAAAMISGCASYDETVAQEVTVKSTPEGATVTINGMKMDAVTDTSFVLKRDRDYVIELSKGGYKPARTRINHRAIDAKEGPTAELESTRVELKLEVDTEATAAAEAAKAKSEAFAKAITPVTAALAATASAVETAVKLNNEAGDIVNDALGESKDSGAPLTDAAKNLEQARADLAKNETDDARSGAKAARKHLGKTSAKLADAKTGLDKARAAVAAARTKAGECAKAIADAKAALTEAAPLAVGDAELTTVKNKTAGIKNLTDYLAETNAKLAMTEAVLAKADAAYAETQASLTAATGAADKFDAELAKAAEDAKQAALAAENARKAEAELAAKQAEQARLAAEADKAAKLAAEEKARDEAAAAKAATPVKTATGNVFAKHKLRQQLKDGKITREQFDERMKELDR